MSDNHSQLVKKHFDSKYINYDELIQKLIPRYEEMHQLAFDAIKLQQDRKARILDLGIGTGKTADALLKKYPKAHIDGYDISPAMIAVAKEKLAQKSESVSFLEQDIRELALQSLYDACIAVLCIHHLNPEEKQALFKKVYVGLKNEAVFVIADIVKFDSVSLTRQKEEEWKEFLKSNFSENEAQYWFENYQEEDLPSSANEQRQWLLDSKFDEVEMVWEHINYAVLVAKKF